MVVRWWKQSRKIERQTITNPLNPPSVSFAGEKIENIGKTELDFALIMLEMDSLLNSA